MSARLPKGTRDFLPQEMIKRKYIFSVIEKHFRRAGYVPIETPAMESLDSLMGKYGEEGDRLLFKILNNGDYLSKADEKALADRNSDALIPSISKRGLRYDLTVPFARYVVMHQNELSFPFKRYQIQPVWRADRPQKGRYQEFYQCDADVVGSKSLIYEAEQIRIYEKVFEELGIPVEIRVNHRSVLSALAAFAGVSDRLVEMTVVIDKLDKVGLEGVRDEFVKRSFGAESIDKIMSVIGNTEEASGSDEMVGELKDAGVNPAVPRLLNEFNPGALEEFKTLVGLLSASGDFSKVHFDLTLARGLNYYTGFIMEVVPTEGGMGSLGGGGRYDDLTAVFGKKDLSGVGISFGAERIFDVMEEKGLFPEELASGVDILFLPIGDDVIAPVFEMVEKMRAAGVLADMYPDAAKLNKQFKYAEGIGARYVCVVGQNEITTDLFELRDNSTREKQEFSFEQMVEKLKR